MASYDDDTVKSALRAVLRPLAELMISSGITLSSATELLKQVLFDAAQNRKGGSTSDSQVSLLTGLHRKDVRRFREAGAGPARASFANASARLIALWASDPAFLDEAGQPRPLPRSAEEGPSFDRLVQLLKVDLAPGTMLTHLKDIGLIEQRPDGAIRLLSSAYVPLAGSREMLAAFEKNIAAHFGAAVDNLTGESSPPHFERASHYNRLSEESAARLEALARQLAEESFATFNAEASRLQRQDMADPASTHRVSFGSYVVDRDQAQKDTSGQ
ncbi:MAG: DUF6502 family protein [Pseudomonadota bacterium]